MQYEIPEGAARVTFEGADEIEILATACYERWRRDETVNDESRAALAQLATAAAQIQGVPWRPGASEKRLTVDGQDGDLALSALRWWFEQGRPVGGDVTGSYFSEAGDVLSAQIA